MSVWSLKVYTGKNFCQEKFWLTESVLHTLREVEIMPLTNLVMMKMNYLGNHKQQLNKYIFRENFINTKAKSFFLNSKTKLELQELQP